MSTSIKAIGVFEGTIIHQIRVYLGSTVLAYGYVYNKVYQCYSTVEGNRVCPAAARLWVKSMGKGQGGDSPNVTSFTRIVFTLVLLVTIPLPLLTRDILLLNHELCHGASDVR